MGKSRASSGLLLLLGILLLSAAGSSAEAQMLGPLMSQMAGPFASRMGAAGADPMAAYRSPAGMTPHMMQGTQALMSPANNTVMSANEPGMATPSGGEKKGADAPDADVGEGFWRVMVGACAGGAFIGGFAVATAVPAAAPAAAAAAAPAALTSFLGALGVGCVLGGATAATSLGAVWVYRELGGP